MSPRKTPKCRECGAPLPIRSVTASKDHHPDPGSYCSSNCVLNAFERGHGAHARIYPEEFDDGDPESARLRPRP